jgi:hypothetical protein
MQTPVQIPTTTLLERILAIVAGGVCLAVTLFLSWSVSATQPIWPLPGLYFIEVILLGGLAAFMFIRGGRRAKFVTWAALGALTGFALLGALSVGFFYLPIALIFAAIAITSDLRSRQPVAAHLAVFLLAGIAQVLLMLAAIRLIP